MIKIAHRESNGSNPPQSWWLASVSRPEFLPVQCDCHADTAIIGGGITGITAAYLLAQQGRQVILLDAGRLLEGTTGHSTAKLTAQHSLIYAKLIKQFGPELAGQYAQANQAAIRFVDEIVKKHDIDCDFSRCSAYVYTRSESYTQQIIDEAEAAAKLGLSAVCTDDCPLPFPVKNAVRFDHQARFHPLKYLTSLLRRMPPSCSVFEATRAVDIMPGHPATVITENGHRITAENVLIASHYPFYDGAGLYFTRMYPSRSYAIGITIKESFPDGMFISAEDPVRSFRLTPFKSGMMLILGGGSHKTGHSPFTSDHYQTLSRYADDLFTVKSMPFHWSAQDYITLDGVPYVGPLTSRRDNVYVASGFGKWGMSNGTAAAMIIRDLICDGDSPWADVYDPSRVTLAASAANFIALNADVAVHYVSGRLKKAAETADLKPGEAAVLDEDGMKTGAFKDEDGILHLVDATCPHLGCCLTWNEAERTWDCPCHGSRFSYTGAIVEGPALYNLQCPDSGPNPVDPHVFQ